MKKLLLAIGVISCITIANADEYPINLKANPPLCGTYTITESSNREDINKYCQVVGTHSGHVRLFRGSETEDFMTNNLGIVSCKFNRSAVNSDGALKKCWTTTPPSTESATITFKSNASTAVIESKVATTQLKS
jgi:hypothetical protein